MANLKNDIRNRAKGKILGVSIGMKYGDWSGKETIPNLMTWKRAAPLLDYDFDDGYGGADCHPVYVWTETQVICVHEYDGATWLVSIPRNPGAVVPEFNGG